LARAIGYAIISTPPTQAYTLTPMLDPNDPKFSTIRITSSSGGEKTQEKNGCC
jgi:hypothetical protein